MSRPDLILLHPPTVFNFRETPIFAGPVGDVVPSTPVFEFYPIGFATISEYLTRHGLSVRIINIALKMLQDPTFDPAQLIGKLDALAFGIDLHWLPHVDGSLSLARLVKNLHPNKPVIIGGLSATYFHEEIMRDYPFVDFVMCGDSTEEPMRLLIEAIKHGTGYQNVPNLAWRDKDGRVVVNERSFQPENLDYVRFDYIHLMKMAIKYRDLSGYIPFKYWTKYPVTAVFTCRGCTHNCVSCGGSISAFKTVCKRRKPCFRSPELVAEDIYQISRYTEAPVIVINDLLQAGMEYGERFIAAMKKYNVKNEIALEFFRPPPLEFIKKVADSIKNFNVEISPESHDIGIRKIFGKGYTNDELEAFIDKLFELGCNRIDLFFMVGLPHQDYKSVMDTVDYCGRLMEKHSSGEQLLPFIAPLAPFVDPGSAIFENPERFGYRLFARTLAEHRKAMLMPSWKYTLNYETDWMTRGDIVKATYNAALKLIELKELHGAVAKRTSHIVAKQAQRALELIEKISDQGSIDAYVREEIFNLNLLDSLCNKHELDWPTSQGGRLKVLKILGVLIESILEGFLPKEFFHTVKKIPDPAMKASESVAE